MDIPLPLADNRETQGSALHEAWPSLISLAAGRRPGRVPDLGTCPLWRLYAPVAQGHGRDPFVIGQLGQSLDGRVATATGKSRTINGPEAIRHLHRLRALVDAVVVGVGTVIADDPRLSVRDVAGTCPARIVIDPNFRMPQHARMLQDGGSPIYAIQCQERCRGPEIEPIVVARTGGTIAPSAIVSALADRGFKRILIEGGARTVSAFLAAGVLHRFHLSIAPIVIGSGPVGITLPPIDELDGALRPRAITHQLGQDVIFDCAFDAVPMLGTVGIHKEAGM